MIEKTFAIIKPDLVAKKSSGLIISLIELNKFTILRMEKVTLTKERAQQFYDVHKERSFFNELVDSMLTGPIIVMALERENAIAAWRELMGATDPQKAAIGTMRYMFGDDIGNNGTHGSDAPETAKQELKFFFPDL